MTKPFVYVQFADDSTLPPVKVFFAPGNKLQQVVDRAVELLRTDYDFQSDDSAGEFRLRDPRDPDGVVLASDEACADALEPRNTYYLVRKGKVLVPVRPTPPVILRASGHTEVFAAPPAPGIKETRDDREPADAVGPASPRATPGPEKTPVAILLELCQATLHATPTIEAGPPHPLTGAYSVCVQLPDGRRFVREFVGVRKQVAKQELCQHVLQVLQKDPLRSIASLSLADPVLRTAIEPADRGDDGPTEVQLLNELVQSRYHAPPVFSFDPPHPPPLAAYGALVRVPGLPVFRREVAGGTPKRLAKRLVAADALAALRRSGGAGPVPLFGFSPPAERFVA